MDTRQAEKVETWRVLDRHVQGLDGARRLRAQAVIDVAEDSRTLARQRGTDPLDDLLELHGRVVSDAARRMVVDAMRYLRAETHLLAPPPVPRRAGTPAPVPYPHAA